MRYVQIDPDWTESDICHAVHDAPKQGTMPSEHFGRSQTLENIPSGRVASRLHDLEEFVVGKTRSTRNQGTSKSHQTWRGDILYESVRLAFEHVVHPVVSLMLQYSTYCGLFTTTLLNF